MQREDQVRDEGSVAGGEQRDQQECERQHQQDDQRPGVDVDGVIEDGGVSSKAHVRDCELARYQGSRECAPVLTCRCELSDVEKIGDSANAWTAKNATLTMRNSWNGAI